MTLTVIIILIVVGLALLVAEIIFVPGTTMVGFFGFALISVASWMSFSFFGSEAGWITVGISFVASVAVFYFSFRSGMWKRFALRTTLRSKVNEGEVSELAPGQVGVTLSALRPVGKGEWNFRTYEVTTNGQYVESGVKIKIIKISLNRIIVEPTP